MAFFGLYDAGIALGQPLKTRIAIALIKALFSYPIAVNAVN
jgi:hypothetical protein